MDTWNKKEKDKNIIRYVLTMMFTLEENAY